MSAAMTALAIERAPLSGTTLIEANAGTGKTWTITALYVRLLLEAGRTVDKILVVTFTEAATAELRDRVRSRLVQTRAALERGEAHGDALIESLLASLPDRERAALQLESALRDFDQAPIHTIHGFCRRVLADVAFESARPFAMDLVPDQSELLREIFDDFWRRELHDASPLFARHVAGQKIRTARFGPESLRGTLDRYIGRPYLGLRSPAASDETAALEQAYTDAYARARGLWLKAHDVVRKQLAGNPALSGQTYRAASVLQWLDELEACLASPVPGVDLFEKLERFTPASLREGTRKGQPVPKHAFYDACETLRQTHGALIAAYEARVADMKKRLLEYCNTELRARKKARQLQSYDDLLLDLHDALDPARGSQLASMLRERYSAALIDEFQDTDPVQYAIFRRIYGGSELPVFFVGDPKQSIYSFRGADVFSYLQARSDAQAAHTLETNWRSDASLVEAVNCVFRNAPAPFVFEDIGFQPSTPAKTARGRFVISRETGAPLEICFAVAENGKAMGKTAARPRFAAATAAEIARLMNLGVRKKAHIVEPAPDGTTHERALRGGDIAVLVRTHREADLVREALTRCGVPSVQRGAGSVFGSAEAEELERVLLAIAEPGREALVCGALATQMMGVSGEGLFELRADEAAWEALIESFREAHRAWHEHGFIRMLRAFLQHHRVMCRMLEYRDGERRVTNLLHLSERLHCQAQARGVAGLIAWLAAKRRSPGSADEEELLRLESDENLVKILTVHVAKGLEFPLVFCPFLWDGGLRSAKDDPIAFHDPSEAARAVLDFGSETLDAGREQAKREERAENLRLFYVALTRAKYRCWMVWGHLNEGDTSAPAWLFHPGGKKLDPVSMRGDLRRLAASAGGTIRVTDLTAPAAVTFTPPARRDAHLTERRFDRILLDTRRVTSFTGLAHGRALEAPDYDAGDRPEEPDLPIGRRDIFAFPRGAHAGQCLHAILEHLDFRQRARADLERIVARDLGLHGFDVEWTRAVADMAEAVLATPLDDAGTLLLANVARAQRLDELEFYYPIAALSDRGVRELLLEWGFPEEIRQRIGTLTFATAQGYMRGFIDLVFEQGGRYYLADYKSNWLGANVEAYGHPQLVKAMAREAYYLQYLVYCVALHRYLGARLPGYGYDTHFGGVRYLFLRGMRPQHGTRYGVYADRPPEGLIRALDDYLRSGVRRGGTPRKPTQTAFEF